jgi:hypothetical protein
MVFQYGKTYELTCGQILRIVGIADTHTYGKCLIGEDSNGRLIPIGQNESYTQNYVEIPDPYAEKKYPEFLPKCINIPYTFGIDISPEVSTRIDNTLSDPKNTKNIVNIDALLLDKEKNKSEMPDGRSSIGITLSNIEDSLKKLYPELVSCKRIKLWNQGVRDNVVSHSEIAAARKYYTLKGGWR